jgi:hypothetical protein
MVEFIHRLRIRFNYAWAKFLTGYGDIHLRGEGEYAIVSVNIQGQEVDVIKEYVGDPESTRTMSHWVTSIGILSDYRETAGVSVEPRELESN